MKIWIISFVCLLLYLVNPSLLYELSEEIVNDPIVFKKWLKASRRLDDLLWHQKDIVINLLDKSLKNKELQLNETCVDALSVLRKGLVERKLWAYKFLDSSAKGKSGLAYGFVSDLGHYDQCLSLNVKEKLGSKTVNFAGQYCLAKLTLPLPKKPEKNWLRPYKLNLSSTELKGTLYEHYGNHIEFFFYETLTFALCVPTACSREDVGKIVEKEFEGSELKAEMRPHCEKYEEVLPFVLKQPNDQLISILVIALVVGYTAFATFWTEVIEGDTFLCHFSAVRNTRKLMTDYKDPANQKLRFLDGYKFWYHMGGCMAHMPGFLPVTPLIFAPIQDISLDMDKYWWISEYSKRSIYMTQVIFLISGFISAYYMYPIIAKAKGKVSFVSFAVKRWLRTAPVTVGCMLLWLACATFFHGPLAQEFKEKYINVCRKNWWQTLLYINNWQPFNEICFPTTWSQSVDFQLWLLSYFPLIWLYKKPKLGVFACFVLIGLGIVIPVWVSYVYELPSTTAGRLIDMLYFLIWGDYFPHMHLNTYNNMSNYFVGILLGYTCVRGLLKPKNELVMWILSIGSLVAFYGSIFLPYFYSHVWGFKWTRTIDLIYSGIFRITFVSVYYVIFYGCFYKKGVVYWGMGRFLDNRFWIPLGRVSYSVYIAYQMTTTYEYVPVNRTIMAINFISWLFLCWLLGYVVFLIFEGPSVSIFKSFATQPSQQKLNNNEVKKDK